MEMNPLSKREYTALCILQALIANPPKAGECCEVETRIPLPQMASMMADHLLAHTTQLAAEEAETVRAERQDATLTSQFAVRDFITGRHDLLNFERALALLGGGTEARLRLAGLGAEEFTVPWNTMLTVRRVSQ